jgi:hypothetical protein
MRERREEGSDGMVGSQPTTLKKKKKKKERVEGRTVRVGDECPEKEKGQTKVIQAMIHSASHDVSQIHHTRLLAGA